MTIVEPRIKRSTLTLQRPLPASASPVTPNGVPQSLAPLSTAPEVNFATKGQTPHNTKHEWQEWHDTGPVTPITLDAKDISWIIEGDGELAGRTIVGLRNAAEPALVLNDRFDAINAWWGRRCSRPRRQLTLAGNERRMVITQDSIAYVKPMKGAEDKAVAGLRGRNVKPVPVAISYQALRDWLSEEKA